MVRSLDNLTLLYNMPLPIFISNPLSSFLASVVIHGVRRASEISLSSLSTVARKFATPQGMHYLTQLLKVLLSMYVLFHGPIYLTLGVIALLNWAFGFRINSKSFMAALDLFISHYGNPQVFLIVLSGFFVFDWGEVFINGATDEYYDSLKHYPSHDSLDNLYGTDRSTQDRSLQTNVAVTPDLSTRLYYLLKELQQFRQFLKRYTNVYAYNTMVFALIHIFPHYRLTPIVLLLLVVQTLLDRIGAFPLIVMAALLNCCSYHYTGMLLSTFYGTALLSNDLVIPYFSRVAFTAYERRQWLKLREGVLWGFSLFFYLLLVFAPIALLWVFAWAQFLMGRFMCDLTDAPPRNKQLFYRWSSKQLMWSPPS